MQRRALFLCVAAFASAWTALAQAQQPRVVVLEFDGPMNQRARGAVLEALASSEQYAIVPRQDAESAASNASADLATPEGRVTVARALSLTAFVGGTVSKRRATFEVALTVYDGATGAPTSAGTARGTKATFARVLRRDAPNMLGGVLSSRSAPAPEPVAEPAPAVAEVEEPEPKPEPKREPKAFMLPVEDEESEGADGKLDALELRLGVRVLARTFRYTDALADLVEHTLTPTPAGDLALRWYPGAHVGTGLAASFGLEASGSFMYPVEVDGDGVAYPTKSFAFGIGAHARFALGDHTLGVLAGYGQSTFAIDDGDDGSDPGIPSVAYGFVRGGLDARIQLSESLALAPRFAYRMLLGYGELAESEWFSRASGGGIEAELLLRYAVLPELTLDLGGGLVRYFLTFDPEPDDPAVTAFGRIAGGAVDQQIYGTLGATLGL